MASTEPATESVPSAAAETAEEACAETPKKVAIALSACAMDSVVVYADQC